LQLDLGSGSVDLGGNSETLCGVTLVSGRITDGTLLSDSYTVESGTVDASLAGVGGLTKTGSGTVTLSAANSYAGGTTVSAGTLVITNAAGLPAGTSLTIGAGGGTVFDAGPAVGGLSDIPAAASPQDQAATGSNALADTAPAAEDEDQAASGSLGAAVLASEVAKTSPEAPPRVLQASSIDLGVVSCESATVPPISVALRSGSITDADVSLRPALFPLPPSHAGQLPFSGNPLLVSTDRKEPAAATAQQSAGSRSGAEDKIRGRALQATLAAPSIIDAAWLQDLTDSQVDARHARQASRSLANSTLDALLMNYVS
jgi:autotransporter-associated beta strand protein